VGCGAIGSALARVGDQSNVRHFWGAESQSFWQKSVTVKQSYNIIETVARQADWRYQRPRHLTQSIFDYVWSGQPSEIAVTYFDGATAKVVSTVVFVDNLAMLLLALQIAAVRRRNSSPLSSIIAITS